jgi:hypothetical protein
MGFTANNWVGSSGGGSFFNSGSSSGGGLGLNGTEFMPKHWDSSSDPTPGKDSTSFDWARSLPAGSDPFGFNKTLNQDKKQSPWGDVARFAGDALNSYAQSKSGQGGSGFSAGGGGGVAQSGDLTIVYPQSPTIIEGKKGGIGGTIGSIAGAALGTLIAPGIGTTIGGQLGGAAGSMF